AADPRSAVVERDLPAVLGERGRRHHGGGPAGSRRQPACRGGATVSWSPPDGLAPAVSNRSGLVGRVSLLPRLSRAGWLGTGVLAAFVLLAVLSPVLVPASSRRVIDATGPELAAPSGRYPLGTDENGLSVLALLVAGARQSLLVGFLATGLAVGFGTLVGTVTGYFRGALSVGLRWLTEWFLVLPQVPFAMALASVLPPGAGPLVLAIAVTSWAGVAGVVRAGVLAARTRPHLQRVAALGAGHWHRIRFHIVPATLPLVAANATLTLANAVLAEATLSFLRLGDPGQPSWGAMLRQASVS